MNSKNIFILAGIVALVLIAFVASRPDNSLPAPDQTNEQKTEGEVKSPTTGSSKSTNTTSKATQTSLKTQSSATVKTSTATQPAPTSSEIEFINKRLAFPLKDFPGVKITIEKVVFGRGDAAMSTGCQGIPNANFSTYLYPGSGICINSSKVDGSPRGIVAFHILIENNGNIGFGGNSDALTLHYLRADSTGTPSYRFAHPIMGLGSYYINGYSSREVILSYLVPEDQTIFNLVSGYKEPSLENKTLNVYDFSTNGLLVDFESKTIKVVK